MADWPEPPDAIILGCTTGGILGVIDGSSPKGVEGPEETKQRKELLRRFGYKL